MAILSTSQQSDVLKAINVFKNLPTTTGATRVSSWNNCHDYLLGLHNKGNGKGFLSLSAIEQEMAELHLGFYLASWGMFRGSAFINKFDHKIYGEILKIAFDKKYDLLWNAKITTNTNLIANLVEDVYMATKKELSNIKNKISTNSTSNTSISDTLVTKILLGVYACIPAYDTYFKKVAKKLGLSQTCNGNIRNLTNLLDFINANSVFDNLAKTYGYPVMKIADMAFFEIGYNPSVYPSF